MRPTCTDGPAVPAYGDPAADFHLIGDHPGCHGGQTTGVPFTETSASVDMQGVLYEVGLLADRYADEPVVNNLFISLIHMCSPPADTTPSAGSYARLERYFDAELRAVNAHILLPVGKRATDRVLEEYTAQVHKIDQSMEARHALEIRGRGFLVIPIKDPMNWSGSDRTDLTVCLSKILASDYRQTKGVATLVG